MIGQAPDATSILPDQWSRKIISWMVAIAAVVFVASQIKGCAEAENRKTAEAAAQASAAAVPTITLSVFCNNEEEYVNLPPDHEVQVVIPASMGATCWTPQIRRPKDARRFTSDPDRIVKVERTFADGSTDTMMDGPGKNITTGFITLRRYQNPSNRPVTATITIN